MSDGVHLIVIFNGMPVVTTAVVRRMLADRRLFRHVGNVGLESESLPLYSRITPNSNALFKTIKAVTPRDDRRLIYCYHLQNTIFDFITAHELTHIAHGHVAYVKAEYGQPMVDELDWLPGTTEGNLESQTMEMDADFTVTVTDPDANDTHTFVLSDSRFEVANGQVKLKAGQSLDFETEPSIDLDITATDAGGLEVTRPFTITVTNLNESPGITSAASLNVAERQTVVLDMQSSDPDGESEGAGLTYSLTGGTDRDRFSIVKATGVLTFKVAPDFEAPQDFGANNIYDVQVTVSDAGGLTDVKDIAVTVTNVSDQDFGDAPDSLAMPNYPTLLAHNGARHTIGSLFLGAGVGGENDGHPTANADGDNDDGVQLVATLVATGSPSISSVFVTASQSGRVASPPRRLAAVTVGGRPPCAAALKTHIPSGPNLGASSNPTHTLITPGTKMGASHPGAHSNLGHVLRDQHQLPTCCCLSTS